MAIFPGSLDYLYHNGILDHIPYEAYEMTPMTPSGMAQMSGMGTGYNLNGMSNGYSFSGAGQYQGLNNQFSGVNQFSGYGNDLPKALSLSYGTYTNSAMMPMNGAQYSRGFQGGLAYDTYTGSDTFVRSRDFTSNDRYSNEQNAQGNGFASGNEIENNAGRANFRQSIMDMASKTKETVSNSPNWVKGILSGGIIITTLSLLLRSKKKPVSKPQTSLLQKLNPCNWFKK